MLAKCFERTASPLLPPERWRHALMHASSCAGCGAHAHAGGTGGAFGPTYLVHDPTHTHLQSAPARRLRMQLRVQTCVMLVVAILEAPPAQVAFVRRAVGTVMRKGPGRLACSAAVHEQQRCVLQGGHDRGGGEQRSHWAVGAMAQNAKGVVLVTLCLGRHKRTLRCKVISGFGAGFFCVQSTALAPNTPPFRIATGIRGWVSRTHFNTTLPG